MTDPSRRTISTRLEFDEAVLGALKAAADAGAAEIVLCDPSFHAWPLGDKTTLDALTRWVGSTRRLTLYARSFDEVARRHGRWTEWRRRWSHAVQCRSNEELEATRFPTLCWVPGLVAVRLFDVVRFRGVFSTEASEEMACREAIDALSQRSEEAFPITTLGI